MDSVVSREIELESAQWKKRELPGFVGVAGPLWTRREGDGWIYGFLADERHLNPAGLVHGGVLATLVDHAASAVAWEASGRKACVTLQLDTHFTGAVKKGDFVEARVGVTQATRNLMFMQGRLDVGDRRVLAAQAILKVIRD